MEIFELYALFNQCNGVSTDTRNITENSIFFALKGENFDANEFAIQALEKGAAFAVVDNKELLKLENNKLIHVSNVLATLQELASFHRYHIGLPIIALTGSNGKTTTKELIHAVLSKKYNTIATIGNLNNHIGVPLTLLRITEETDLAIIEMGANHQGEIAELCKIAQPDFGLITNFGKAHLEGFGGYDGVIKGKSEMFDYLKAEKKTAFINSDDPIQVDKSTDLIQYKFSLNNLTDANVILTNTSASPMAYVEYKDITIQSQLTGTYNIANIAYAVTIGAYFNINKEDIKVAIESYTPTNNRSQWIEKSSKKILLDAYNANPSSMMVAINNFTQLQGNEKLMILGDMFELGEDSNKEHIDVIQHAISSNISTIFIGENFFSVAIAHDNLQYFNNIEAFFNCININNITKELLLIKGSRGMALERIVHQL